MTANVEPGKYTVHIKSYAAAFAELELKEFPDTTFDTDDCVEVHRYLLELLRKYEKYSKPAPNGPYLIEIGKFNEVLSLKLIGDRDVVERVVEEKLVTPDGKVLKKERVDREIGGARKIGGAVKLAVVALVVLALVMLARMWNIQQ